MSHGSPIRPAVQGSSAKYGGIYETAEYCGSPIRLGAVVPKVAPAVLNKTLFACLFPRVARLVHSLANGAGSFNQFRIGLVRDRQETDLVIFTVAASGQGLVAPLEPVGPDKARMVEALSDEIFIALRTLGLTLGWDKTGVEESAVERAEVKLAIDHGLVLGIRWEVLVDATAIDVDADHITILGGGAVNARCAPGNTRAQIELVRRLFAQHIADGLEIHLCDLRMENSDVRGRPCFGRNVLALKKLFP